MLKKRLLQANQAPFRNELGVYWKTRNEIFWQKTPYIVFETSCINTELSWFDYTKQTLPTTSRITELSDNDSMQDVRWQGYVLKF